MKVRNQLFIQDFIEIIENMKYDLAYFYDENKFVFRIFMLSNNL